MSNFAAALKNELRVRMKSLREQIADRRGKSLMIAERLCSSEMYKSAEVIAFYLNIGSEVETKDMIQKAHTGTATIPAFRKNISSDYTSRGATFQE